mgnify:CR=1 FL=1
MPGGIMTNLQRNMTQEDMRNFGLIDSDGKAVVNDRLKNVEQGAATTIYACVASELEGKGGLYLEDCQISPVKSQEAIRAELAIGTYMPVGLCPYAKDEASADKLWDLSEKEINARSA